MYRVEGVRGRKLFTGIAANGLSQIDFLARLQRHKGFLPIGVAARLSRAFPAILAANTDRVNANDMDLEQFLNRLPNLDLVSTAVGDDSILIKLLPLHRPLFCHADRFDDFKRIHG